MTRARNDANIEDLLRDMEKELYPWPPRANGDFDIGQLASKDMWACPERTARDRVKRLVYSGGGKWQWIKVRGPGSRGIMVLRKNEAKTPHNKSGGKGH